MTQRRTRCRSGSLGRIGTSLALSLSLGLTSPAISLAGAGASPDADVSREFSADIVTRDSAGAVVSARLNAANDKVRIETSEAAAGFFLIDGKTGAALLVRPTQRLFMDARQSTRLTQVFIPIDPRDPCPQWQAAEKSAGVPDAAGAWRCTRINAVEYRVVSADGSPSQRWIDPELEFPVKVRAADGTTVTLAHIRVAAQPAGLFEVPSGYRKFDPQGLIDRIKHSDVWAAPTTP
jgi:hypothetical protein